MRIAILLPDLRVGGVERMRIVLAREWVLFGHEVIFLVLRDFGGLISKVREEFPVYSINANRMRDSIWKLRKILKITKPDILLVGMWPLTIIGLAGAALTFENFRVHVSEHISFKHTPELKSVSGKIGFWFTVSIFYRFARSIICVSEGVTRDIRSFAIVRRNQIKLVNNPAYLNVNEHVRYLESNKEFYTILSVGTLKDQKDFSTLLHAFSMLKPRGIYRLCLVGDGPERESLERLVDSLGLGECVEFAGEQLDLDSYYQIADVFVLSSRYEGFANVIVEAMSYGIQIVSTDCEHGPREILLDGKCGRLVPVADPSSMAIAIDAAITKPISKEVIKSRASMFSPTLVAEKYLKIFAEK